MTSNCFDEILSLIDNDIRKMDTNFREAISSKERLAITLRFLATGDSFRTIAQNFRVGFSTVGAIVLELCETICTKLQSIYMLNQLWKFAMSPLKVVRAYGNSQIVLKA